MTSNRSDARTWSPLHAGTARLVRLVLDDEWAAEPAAHSLLGIVHDPAALDVITANVRRAAAERPTSVTARALQTLNHAVSVFPTAASPTAVG